MEFHGRCASLIGRLTNSTTSSLISESPGRTGAIVISSILYPHNPPAPIALLELTLDHGHPPRPHRDH